MSIWSGIRNTVEDSIPVLGPMLQGQRQAGAQNDLMNQINSQMNPLYQPQRQQYQAQLGNLLTPEGAKSFLANDPEVKAGTEFLQNQGTSNFAKSGNLNQSALNQNAAITQLFGQQYNNRVNQLSGLGGFNSQIPGFLPSTVGGMGQQGINSLFGGQAQAGGQLMNLFGGMGGFPGVSNMFGGFLGNMFGGGGAAAGAAPGMGAAGMGMDSIANAGPLALAAF